MAGRQVTAGEEEYLQTLFWLQEAGLGMSAANLARALQLSAPTVHEMVGRLERDGYITRDAEKTISFTPEGIRHAERIVARHRLIERFLTDVLDVPWDEVHEQAESLEHGMSPELEARIRAKLGEATSCPHGHPIALGQREPGVPLADVAVGAKVEVLRFENEAQDILRYLKQAGLEPQLKGVVVESGPTEVVVRGQDGRICTVTRSVAETVSVRANPSPPPRTALPEYITLGHDRYGR